MTERALIYCRISTAGQTGLQSQELRCRKYVAEKGYQVEAVFPDDASGKGDFMARPGMRALLAYLEENIEHNYVVVFDDLKRFARDTLFHLILRIKLRSLGARPECLNFEFDESPEGLFKEIIISATGQLDLQTNNRQTDQKTLARQSAGLWARRPPWGYKMEERKPMGKMLVPDEPLASKIKFALEGYASGHFETQSEVQRYLEATPEFPKAKNGKVHLQRVKNLLTRRLYTGWITDTQFNISMMGRHEPLISLETFDQIQDRLAGRAKAPVRKNLAPDFPLRGMVQCSLCHAPFTASWSRGNGGSYSYYRCDQKNCDLYGKSIRGDELEPRFETLLEEITPSKPILGIAQKMFSELWETRRVYQEQVSEQLKTQHRALEQKIEKSINKVLDLDSPSVISALEKRIEEMEVQKAKIAQQCEKSSEPLMSFEDTFGTAMRFLANPLLVWRSSQYDIKIMVLRMCFTERLTYIKNQGFEPPSIAQPFRLLGHFDARGYDLVPKRGLEPPRA